MKHVIAVIAAVSVVAFAVVFAASLRAESVPDHVGEWELDHEKNADIADLYTVFGSSLRQFGAALNVRADGGIDYHIGLSGGEGTFKVIENTIVADLVSYNGRQPYKASFSIVKEDGLTYLIYNHSDALSSRLIWWRKKSR